MPKIPYFPFYPSDWLGSRKVMLMTDAQRGIYITLLAHQWSDPSNSIPTDRKILQRLLPGSKWENVKYVLQECFDVEGTQEERARNARLSVEHSKAILKSEKASVAAKCKWDKEKQDANAERTHMRTQSERNAIIPISISKKNLSTGKPEKRFSPPSVEEVKSYCQERNNGIDAELFVSWYESKNWMIGKNKMKNWKSAVHTWEKRRSGGEDMAKKTAEEELISAAKNVNNKALPPMSVPATTLFYRIGMKWDHLKKFVQEHGSLPVPQDQRPAMPDHKMAAAGE